MNENEYEYLKERYLKLYGNVSISREEKQEFFNIYNRIAKDQKRNLTCGACVRSVFERLRGYYEQYETTMNGAMD
jgi:hypothetical protein